MAVAQVRRGGTTNAFAGNESTPLVDRATQQVASKSFRERVLEQGVIASGFFGTLGGSVLGAVGKVSDVSVGIRILGGFLGGVAGLAAGGTGGIVTSKVREMMNQANLTPLKRGLIGAAGGSALAALFIVILEANGWEKGLSTDQVILDFLKGTGILVGLFGGGGFAIGYCSEAPIPAMFVGASAGGSVGAALGTGVGAAIGVGPTMGSVVGMGVGSVVTAAHAITGCLSPMIVGHHVLIPNGAATTSINASPA